MTKRPFEKELDSEMQGWTIFNKNSSTLNSTKRKKKIVL